MGGLDVKAEGGSSGENPIILGSGSGSGSGLGAMGRRMADFLCLDEVDDLEDSSDDLVTPMSTPWVCFASLQPKMCTGEGSRE